MIRSNWFKCSLFNRSEFVIFRNFRVIILVTAIFFVFVLLINCPMIAWAKAAGLARGDELYKGNDFAGALEAYSSYISSNPKSAEAYEKFGATLGAMGRYKDAISAISFALKLEPGRASAIKRLAYFYMKDGQTEKAKEILGEVKAQSGSPASSSGGDSDSAIRGGVDKSEILSGARQLAESDSDSLRDLYRLYAEAKYDEALALAQRGATAGDAESLFILGSIYSLKDRKYLNESLALECLKKAIDKGSKPALVFMGVCCQNGDLLERDRTKAFEIFKKLAIAENSSALFRVGRCYQQGWGTYKDPNEARKYFKRSIEVLNKQVLSSPPELPYLYRILSWNYEHGLEQDDEAIKVLKGGILALPKVPALRTDLAAIYMKKKKYKLAVKELEESIRLGPRFSRAYTTLGRIYFAQKKYSKAISVLKNAVDIYPENREARFLIACSLNSNGNSFEAESEYLSLLDGGNERGIYNNLGQIYVSRKDYKKARIMLEEAAKQGSSDAEKSLRWLDNNGY